MGGLRAAVPDYSSDEDSTSVIPLSPVPTVRPRRDLLAEHVISGSLMSGPRAADEDDSSDGDLMTSIPLCDRLAADLEQSLSLCDRPGDCSAVSLDPSHRSYEVRNAQGSSVVDHWYGRLLERFLVLIALRFDAANLTVGVPGSSQRKVRDDTRRSRDSRTAGGWYVVVRGAKPGIYDRW